MITKGIRGATTVDKNTKEALKKATLELLNELIIKNSIKKENISHVIFTLTNDLNAEFPAKFARLELGWDDVAMMCFNELNVPDSLKMCLRVLIVLNCASEGTPEFVYLKKAKTLRNHN
jgi:chorismate mutase